MKMDKDTQHMSKAKTPHETEEIYESFYICKNCSPVEYVLLDCFDYCPHCGIELIWED